MKELNLVEILKDCPQGTKLWTDCCGEVEFIEINKKPSRPIFEIKFKCRDLNISTDRQGRIHEDGIPMLFPSKDNRDWSTFRIPFNEGDFIYTECNSGNEWISIYKFRSKEGVFFTYANFYKGDKTLNFNESRGLCNDEDIKYQRLASDAEIEQVIKALHMEGYNWNNEAKKIEKIEEDKPKWNPETLQPFDKVLVRDADTDYWDGDCYIHTDKETGSDYPYYCLVDNYKICIPFNDETKHLLGTNQAPPEFYQL